MRIESSRVCVYTHSIDGIVFYVGKGVCYRPFEASRRNERWSAAVEAAGGIFDVDILGWFGTDQEACTRELQEIQSRKPSANLMNNGLRRSDEFKAMMSLRHKGKLMSAETRKKLSDARSGTKAWNRGKSTSVEQIEKLTKAARKRSVIDITTGHSYESIHAAARILNIRKEGIQSNLGGRQKTVGGRSFRYA